MATMNILRLIWCDEHTKFRPDRSFCCRMVATDLRSRTESAGSVIPSGTEGTSRWPTTPPVYLLDSIVTFRDNRSSFSSIRFNLDMITRASWDESDADKQNKDKIRIRFV
jgi:hypothetical protein